MHEFLLLIRLNLKNMLGSLKKKQKKGSLLAGSAGLVLLGLFLAFCMTVNALSTAELYRLAGLPQATLFSGSLYALLITLSMAVMRSGAAQKSSDADLLLSLPISRSVILLAKSAALYLFEAIPLTVFFLPFLIVYCITMSAGMLVVLRGLLVLLLTPLLPVGISYLLSWLFFCLGSRLRNPQHIATAFALVLLVAYLLFVFMVSGNSAAAPDIQSQFRSFPPAAWMMQFIAFGDLSGFVAFLALTVLPFALGVRLSARIFGREMRSFHSQNKTLDFRPHSPLRALLRKESRRYFSSSTYVVNTIFGLVMMVAATAALLIFRSRVLELLALVPMLSHAAAPLLTAAYSWIVSTVSISAVSVSLEGRSLWLLKSLPVQVRDIFAAKILFNVIIVAPVALVCTVCSACALDLPFGDALAVVLATLLAALLIAVVGLCFNLLFPRLDWTDESAVVKRSMSMMLSFFLGGFLVAAMPVGCLLLFAQVRFSLTGSALAVIYLLLSIILWRRLNHAGKRRFAALS